MNYRKATIGLLKNKSLIEGAVSKLQQDIAQSEEQNELLESKKCLLDGDTYKVLKEEVEKELFVLRFLLRQANTKLERIERGFSALSDYQKDLLQTFFVEYEGGDCTTRCLDLEEAWEKERSTIYRDKKYCVRSFRFGCVRLLRRSRIGNPAVMRFSAKARWKK